MDLSDDDRGADLVLVLPDLEDDEDVDDEAGDANETHNPIHLQRCLKFGVRYLSDADVVVHWLTTYNRVVRSKKIKWPNLPQKAKFSERKKAQINVKFQSSGFAQIYLKQASKRYVSFSLTF